MNKSLQYDLRIAIWNEMFEKTKRITRHYRDDDIYFMIGDELKDLLFPEKVDSDDGTIS